MVKIPNNIDDIDPNAGGGDFAPLPPGQYAATVAKATETTTQAGVEGIVLELVITDPAYTGRKVWDRIYPSGKTLPRFKLVCQRLGVKLAPGADLTPAVFVGRVTAVTLKIESFNGKDSNKIAYDGYAELPQVEYEDPAFMADDDGSGF